MNILELYRKVNLIHWLSLLGILSGAALLYKPWTAGAAQPAPATAFIVRSHGGKCLDFGTLSNRPILTGFGAPPVVISDCNGSAAQQVRVEELADRPGRLVILRAGSGVIGKKQEIVLNPGDVSAAQEERRSSEQSSFGTMVFNVAADQTPLEVQPYTGSDGQIFALDGDSVILAADRNLVVETQHNRGANRTPLVLGRRDLDDSEFWTFTAADGSAKRPTSGFVRVPAAGDTRDLATQLVGAVQTAQPGTVIEIEQDVDLTNQPSLLLSAGVTLRGDRRGPQLGPELRTNTFDITLIEIGGNDTRVTGLRIKGPSRDTDGDTPGARGVLAFNEFLRTNIDHNDISDWPTQAVDVFGDQSQPEVCRDHRDPKRLGGPNVRVARNFIHHNRKQEKGYGVEAHYGGFPLIEGNTFVENRHAIMADGKACTSYLAYHNLVLSSAPKQYGPIPGFGFDDWYTHDFDAHGTGTVTVSVGVYSWDITGFGGRAGKYFEIAGNTFLGTNRANFDLRGEPTLTAEFGRNISLRSLGDAIECGKILGSSYCGGGINKLRVYDDNKFNAINPTAKFGVGDFDGDGKDDLFLATGAAWYYSPGGKAEWRFLNARSEKLDQLLFGDFDGDKRTDVFTQHVYSWDVSWGGASRWENINVSWSIMGAAATGDFNGDGRDDVFYADGAQWLVSYSGTGTFTQMATAVHRVADLRFGDFNGDGKTDVFGVVGANWMAVYGGTNHWSPLRAKLTNGVAGLSVADFNGDGRDDIARTIFQDPTDFTLYVSFGGVGDWTTMQSWLGYPMVFGRFDGAPGADALFWSSGNALDITSGGSALPRRHSRQDMR